MTSNVLSTIIKNIKQTDDPLSPLIDQYMLKRDKSPTRYWDAPESVEDRYRPGGRLSPSSICGCKRQAVFKFTGARGRKIIEPETETIFDDGKWRHLRLDWQLHDMEAVLGRDVLRVISIEEFVSFEELRIAGSLDAAISIYGYPYVIDFKGINNLGFEWIQRRREPKQAHVRQLISYMRLRRIKRGILWYENKNNGHTLIFMVDFTAKMWKEVKEWCEDVIDDMERERLPLRHSECKKGRFNFGRCPYADTCFGNKTDAQIERETYKSFTSVEDLWQQGMKNVNER